VSKRGRGGEDRVRRLALDICLAVLDHGESLSRLLEQRLAALDDGRDRAFCSQLCFGFCRYYYLLDSTLSGLLKKPFRNKDRDVRVLLMLGLYQLRFMRVGDHAAVNESVSMLRSLRKDWAKGLVNAVLRGYLRSMGDKPNPDLSADEQMAAYPGWIGKRVQADWPQQAGRVLAAGNAHPPMLLRIDTRRVSREDYLRQLDEAGIAGSAHGVVGSAIRLERPLSVDELPGFDQGLVSVQDAAAQLAADLLDCKPGMRVLDACAAPGGKTIHLLQRTGELDLVALDKDEQRLARVRDNLARSGLQATLIAADAACAEDWYDGVAFDRILLDAPCSASGIMRRHPDIRLLRRADDISRLAQQQARLLAALWPLLKPGGRMLYCTCSIFRQENESRIDEFLQATSDCVEVPLNTESWGQARPHGRQILPGFDDMDGFYYACLSKEN
jgi:16S rRNA (cytosine967-C5)-methyltransferase